MRCPHCEHDESRVIDSRSTTGGIRRRRQCLQCGIRFTTYERPQALVLMVVKKDGRREEFSREKLAAGFHKACAKRPVSEEAIERTVDQIEQELQSRGSTEIAVSDIGELVMESLEHLDRVAYIRFASVYREFGDIETFKREIDALIQSHKPGEVSIQLPMIPSHKKLEYHT